jgi:hypothetical protein
MKTFLVAATTLLLRASLGLAQVAATAPASPAPSPTASPGSATAEQVVVTSQELDISREQIVPSLGATRYTVGPDRLDSQAQGENAPFNQTILRFPGVAQDSFGQLHVRGEHANLQYRIDDVLLPESIPGFGQELETRFADNISLITGALPAQFGFRTTGVIDIHTKDGAFSSKAKPPSTSGVSTQSCRALNTGASPGNLAITLPRTICTAASALRIRLVAATRSTTTQISTSSLILLLHL